MKSIIQIALLFLLVSVSLYGQDIDQKKYKVIEPIYYDMDSNFILVEKDSTMFDGYLVFQSMFTNENYTREDKNYVDLNIFFKKDLNDFGNIKNRYYHSTVYHWYLANNDISRYLDHNNENDDKDTLLNIYKLKRAFINSYDYKRFKNLYLKCYELLEKDINPDIFLKTPLSTQIFDNPNVSFMNYMNCDTTGYFIFKCSFPTSVLKYKSSYVVGKDSKGDLIKEYPGYINVLMPIGSLSYLKIIDEDKLIKFGFKKAKWFPDYIFNY